jgi:hypothetical protein
MKSMGRKPWIAGLLALTSWMGSMELNASQEVFLLAPRQVVERWLQVYPGKMEQAAEMTTAAFREGKSKEDWIATQGPFLQDLGMKYVRAKIVHEEKDGKSARVIVHAHIVTEMGDHPQDELYLLVFYPEDGWLIDQVEVYTETFNRVP